MSTLIILIFTVFSLPPCKFQASKNYSNLFKFGSNREFIADSTGNYFSKKCSRFLVPLSYSVCTGSLLSALFLFSLRSFLFSPDVPIKLDYHGKRLDMEQVNNHILIYMVTLNVLIACSLFHTFIFVNLKGEMSNKFVLIQFCLFYSVVDRGNGTQIQVGENLNSISALRVRQFQ